MPYLLKAENRPIALPEIKRIYYPSPIPKSPEKDAFVAKGVYFYENEDRPEVTIAQTAVLINEFVEIKPNRYQRKYEVRDKFQDIDSARVSKLVEISAWYNSEMNKISAGLSQHEINTFYRQDLEAQQLSTAPNATAPFVRRQAELRGIGFLELSDKILAKAAIFNEASATLLGTKQKLEDDIEKATSIEDVLKVEVPGGSA